MSALHLCANCLGPEATPCPVGPEKGHQMDRYTDTIDLCPWCRGALLKADFVTLSARHRAAAAVKIADDGTVSVMGLYGGRDK